MDEQNSNQQTNQLSSQPVSKTSQPIMSASQLGLNQADSEKTKTVARKTPLLYVYCGISIVLTSIGLFDSSNTKQKLLSQPGANPTAVNQGQDLALIIIAIFIAINIYMLLSKSYKAVKRILLVFLIIEILGLLLSLNKGAFKIVDNVIQLGFTGVVYYLVWKASNSSTAS